MADTATFCETTTAEEVVRAFPAQAHGRVVLITGGNTGIGFETARVLAAAGATVYLTCRTQAKADDACARIREKHAQADVHGLELELDSLASVRRCAAAFLTLNVPLHILINNAGIMFGLGLYATTKDGFEEQFGINFVAHFLLTQLLLDKLVASAPARVISVSSSAHYVFEDTREGIPFDDLHAEQRYRPEHRYAVSKLANILHMKELQRRMDESGANVTCVSLHPGVIPGTELHRHPVKLAIILRSIVNTRAIMFMLRNRTKSVPEGAATTVFTALSPTIVKGEYYADCQVAPIQRGHFIEDAALARRLYEVAETLVAGNS